MFRLRFGTASDFFAFVAGAAGGQLLVRDAANEQGGVYVGADWPNGRTATCDEVVPGDDPRVASALTVGDFA